MAKNYAALASSVITALGGVDNISAVTHCMTRLRFVIKDDQLIDSPTLKTIPGVLGVVRSDNQCHVIIGNTVSLAFQEVVSLLPGDMQPAQPVGKPKLTLRRIGAGILDALIGTMSPLIPAIIGGSMVKLLAMLLEMSGVLTKGSPTLTILNVIGDGAFFFLPLMVAASAAIKFKTNMSLAIAIAGVLVHPSFIELMAKAAQGEHVEFALIPVTAVKYTYTVIPALVMAVLMMVLIYIYAVKRGYERTAFNLRNLARQFVHALPACITPVIILAGFTLGWFTPTEASAVATIYALIISVLVYKSMDLKTFLQCLKESAISSANTLFIIGTSTLFTYVMAKEGISALIANTITGVSSNPAVVMFIINIILLILGMVMEPGAILTLMLPVLLPIANTMGYNLVYFGVVVVLNLMIGQVTPPFGVCLFVISDVNKIKLERIYKAILPFLVPLLITLAVTCTFPQVVTFLPDMLLGATAA